MQSNALERSITTAPVLPLSSRVLCHFSTFVRRHCCPLNQNTERFGCTLIPHRLRLDLDQVKYLLENNLFCQFYHPFDRQVLHLHISCQLERQSLTTSYKNYDYRIWEMIYTFSLTIYKGISVFCKTFLLFNLLSSFTVSSYKKKLKLNVDLPSIFIRSIIAFVLGWFLLF